MATVLVCGGRDFGKEPGDQNLLDSVLSEVYAGYTGGITLLVHGGAPGADTMAGEWAERNGVPVRVFPAEWKKHGPVAGPLRNTKMLAESTPDCVVAFPGGRGTADMVRKARAADPEPYLIAMTRGRPASYGPVAFMG